jgi:dihydrofolate reductase
VVKGLRTSVFVGSSVDGFIARQDGSFDWLTSGTSEPFDNGYGEFIATVDALVIGRKTYEVVLGFERWFYESKPVFVLSSRPLRPAPAGAVVERVSGAPAEIVTQLAERGYRHLYIDGGLTIQEFLRAGLIDRMVITRVPVLIGEGIPLFGETGRDIRLHHVATRTLGGGAVQTEYVVANGRE